MCSHDEHQDAVAMWAPACSLSQGPGPSSVPTYRREASLPEGGPILGSNTPSSYHYARKERRAASDPERPNCKELFWFSILSLSSAFRNLCDAKLPLSSKEGNYSQLCGPRSGLETTGSVLENGGSFDISPDGDSTFLRNVALKDAHAWPAHTRLATVKRTAQSNRTSRLLRKEHPCGLPSKSTDRSEHSQNRTGRTAIDKECLRQHQG